MGKKKRKNGLSAIEEADAATVDAIAPYSGSKPVKLLSLLSEIGDQPPMRALCVALIAAGAIGRSRRLAAAGLHMLAAHHFATRAKDALKLNVDRTRPRSRSGPDGHRLAAGKKKAKEETSFPSGHSAGAIAVARAFARHYPEHEKAALAAAGLVAIVQIPRCAHYPSDVAAGLAIGVASEAAADGVERLIAPVLPSL